ncbi:unnamed protein product [Schistocephalus solidus]|uniref:Reverse transcriptase domain-containing protein n=1 Tax=Schistocephalus solidus TaxID=70667 RepID=A0A183SW40_SCHSO|nr:unnamed protein product [Schistocephalus solidus]
MYMVRQLHDGMTARVTDHGTVSEAFAVANVVKQGCVLAPNLFSLMFSAMLMDACHDEHPGIRIAYRTDGHLSFIPYTRNHRGGGQLSWLAVPEALASGSCPRCREQRGESRRRGGGADGTRKSSVSSAVTRELKAPLPEGKPGRNYADERSHLAPHTCTIPTRSIRAEKMLRASSHLAFIPPNAENRCIDGGSSSSSSRNDCANRA